MRGPAVLALALAFGCGAQLDDDSQNTTVDGAPDNPDGPVAPDAFQLGPWGPPTPVPGASTATPEDDGSMSSGALELVFSFADPADSNRKHLFMVSRASTSDPFGSPVRLDFNVNGATDQTPRFSADDLTLYFASTRDPNTNGLDVWRVTRPAVGAAFGTPSKVGGIDDATADDKWFMPCAGNRYLLISSRGGQEDVYEGILGMGTPTRVPELSSAGAETGTFLSEDCLTVYFASTRSGQNRLYTASRAAVDQGWSLPQEVLDFMPGATENQEDPWISADGRTFVFSSNIAGNKDVFISTR